MKLSVKSAILLIIFASALLWVADSCSHNNNNNTCNTTTLPLTVGIKFKLKDTAGHDILPYNASTPTSVPDSITLQDSKTGMFYPLSLGQDLTGSLIYSPQYMRPVNIIDSLIFYYYTSIPDTLVVYTGLVKSWRGDECDSVLDAGITKVTLRNQVLVQTTKNDAVFTLTK